MRPVLRLGAMILAAGRGERMRPLSDTTPKPLLEAGGKPLLVWQIEALARAGFRDIVVNAAHLAGKLVAAVGTGAALGVSLRWSFEPEALETAGGIATALPLLPPGPALVVSGDVWTEFDYATLRARAEAMACNPAAPRAHLVMVPNPTYHPHGDFALDGDAVALDGAPRTTFGNIAVYDTALFRELPRGAKLKLLPYLQRWIAEGRVSGARFDGGWANVGTPDDLAELDRELQQRLQARRASVDDSRAQPNGWHHRRSNHSNDD
jgi:MurNAc alpha-1-phosphate uridylyltransferase